MGGNILFIAHKTEAGILQSIQEHSESTAKLCKNFAIEPFKNLMYEIGLMHDIGKYQKDFQKRINGENIKIPHALCGAKLATEIYKIPAIAIIIQYVIAGHHRGLYDAGNKTDTEDHNTLYGTLKRKTQDYSAFKQELTIGKTDIEIAKLQKHIGGTSSNPEEISERFAFVIRYCFSCLTDADWLDTEYFYTGKLRNTIQANFSKCLECVNHELAKFKQTTPLQKARARLQKQVFEKINIEANFYLMNMPTGSGKTLCSLKFALERAIISKKKRIIYVIPYNSIIDQTAQVFQNIFKEHALVLRHQSTFSFENLNSNNEEEPLFLKQATENWDAQIIITTAVQFFESLYSNKRQKLRKLHNMADSIIIFDEAHLMPKDFLQPCLQAITHITEFLNSQAVFLTATMPDFRWLLKEFSSEKIVIEDLVLDKKDFSFFKKCSYLDIGTISKEELVCEAQDNPSTLIVVNKRSTARAIYTLAKNKKVYHLSTYMTAYDRVRVITKIHLELAQLEKDYTSLSNIPLDQRIIVVATSLIEAGVDLDFHAVYRQLWGLDSILQAGGRCNREGKLANARVNIFQLTEESAKTLEIEQELTKGIIQEYADISQDVSIENYFTRLLKVKKENISKYSLGKQCIGYINIPFASYAENFKLINSNTVSIAVPQDGKSRAMLTKLQQTGYINSREVQYYTCSVYENEFRSLLNQGVLSDYGSGIYWLTNPDYYDENIGILLEGQDKYF